MDWVIYNRIILLKGGMVQLCNVGEHTFYFKLKHQRSFWVKFSFLNQVYLLNAAHPLMVIFCPVSA